MKITYAEKGDAANIYLGDEKSLIGIEVLGASSKLPKHFLGREIPLSILQKYTSYFHDGSILAIRNERDKIVISMESSEILEEELEDDCELSEQGRIRGTLYLEKVKDITLNEKPFHETLKMEGDLGDILKFRVEDDCVSFYIQWMNFPPKEEIDVYSDLQIQAGDIHFINFGKVVPLQ